MPLKHETTNTTVRPGCWQVVPVKTTARNQIKEITKDVGLLVEKSGVNSGYCHLFVTHANAGFLSTGDADSLDVMELVIALEEELGVGKFDLGSYIATVSETVPIERGKLVLNRGGEIFLCESDGPRQLELMVKIEEQ